MTTNPTLEQRIREAAQKATPRMTPREYVIVRDAVDAILPIVAAISAAKTGCGQPGHAAIFSDEGTGYCLACELQGQLTAAAAEIASLQEQLKERK